MATELKELVIDRSKWGKYALLNADGTMCCLGFAAKACGVKTLRLGICACGSPECSGGDLNIGFPCNISIPQEERDQCPAWLLDRDFCGDAARANDQNENGPEREKAVADVFAPKGCKVSFVGEYK